MNRVPKMARGKISLASGIQCCSIFFLFLCPTTVPLWITCAYIHISDCVETVYELPLLPNNTASEIFLHESGGIFIIGVPAWWWLGEQVTGKNDLQPSFYTGISSCPSYCHIFFLIAFLQEPFIKNKIQQNSTYPDAGYPDRQFSRSAWPFG
jgi:hypothetical protein